MAVLVVIAAVIGWGAWLAWDAYQAQGEADALQSSAARAQEAVSARDVDTLRGEVETLSEAANSFYDHTHGIHWTLATYIPWVKDQVRPLQAAGVAVKALADDALAPLSELEDLDALANPEFVDGRIDPYFMEPYRPTLEQVQAVLVEQADALAEVDTSNSVVLVSDAFDQLTGQLSELATMVDDATTLAQLLPGMLGGEEPRTYAVMIQNNAEPRASGGIPGAVIMVTIDDGQPLIGEYFSAGELNAYGPATGATDEELEVFGDQLVNFSQTVNATPQFPRAAIFMSQYIEGATGEAPDGVISLDPVALGYMMGDAESQTIMGIDVSGENLAEVMLNQVYFEFEDPNKQDEFFAAAASALFGEVLGGGSSAVDGLERALDENRFSVWSATESEQAILESTPAGGDQLRDDVWAGAFLNDGAASKIGYYVDMEVVPSVGYCASDGRVGSAELDVTLTHTYDGDVASLPDYVASSGVAIGRGEFIGGLYILVPDGYRILSVAANGEPIGYTDSELAGRRLVELQARLAPGESTQVTVSLEPESSYFGIGEVVATPGSKPVLNVSDVDTFESPC
ncbi:DUF4012 domain-containing protein [Demequina sp. NBRC 110054]|uniref:DUF4012 domain-containing protein n=1 Tax=Demequina sp. NBRC 110054 TaxID=1570343 RepID=UPI0013564828|nr:DUF4012 domain-containing protein [Demequina sp. NBRC 110054]